MELCKGRKKPGLAAARGGFLLVENTFLMHRGNAHMEYLGRSTYAGGRVHYARVERKNPSLGKV